MHNNIRIWVVSESRNILIPPSGAILREEDKKFINSPKKQVNVTPCENELLQLGQWYF